MSSTTATSSKPIALPVSFRCSIHPVFPKFATYHGRNTNCILLISCCLTSVVRIHQQLCTSLKRSLPAVRTLSFRLRVQTKLASRCSIHARSAAERHFPFLYLCVWVCLPYHSPNAQLSPSSLKFSCPEVSLTDDTLSPGSSCPRNSFPFPA